MKYVFLLAVYLFSVTTQTGEPVWMSKLRQIEILKSKREDVERIFDSPLIIETVDLSNSGTTGWREYVEYKTKDGDLTVYYSIGRCAELPYKLGYDVERGIVVKIEFEPRKRIPIEQLNFDYKTFDWGYTDDVPGSYSGGNNELGVDIYFTNKKLNRIEFEMPSSKDYLSCAKVN